MAWWLENNLRLIQTNLRDSDADLDIDRLIAAIKTYSCNVLMVGAGGISAFYPSELEFTKPCIHERDTLGELVRQCHAEGIRIIARFDFSKTHESLYELHPEWYYRSPAGQPIHYNDTVHTCLNGEYQQQRSLEIIREVISRYPVDGIFFNMFGYKTSDYSNNYYGICHCDACRKRFFAYGGMELPASESPNEPAYQKYAEFKEFTVGEMLRNIRLLAKSVNPEIAVCTYHHKDVDIIRKESNSAIDRPYPFWIYSGSENVASVRHTWADKIISNCVINAVDIFYRFMGVSKELTRIRLYQSMAAGSGLDFCIIGVFDGYPDRANFESVHEVYDFHAKNRDRFGKLGSMAKVLLVKPALNDNLEYRGLFKVLKEAHIPFDVGCVPNLEAVMGHLQRYRMVVIPDLHAVSANQLAAMKAAGLTVIVTGLVDDRAGEKLLYLGINQVETMTNTRSAYLLTDQKTIFKSFPQRDWVFIDGPFGRTETWEQKLLPLVNPANFGPPERCFGHRVSGCPGVIVADGGKTISLTWNPGRLYYKHGFEDHKNLLLDLIDYYCPEARACQTNAPNSVELFYDRCGPDELLLQFINLSGFNGTTVGNHLRLHGLTATIPLAAAPAGVSSLTTAAAPEWTYRAGLLTIMLNPLEAYEALVIHQHNGAMN